MLHLGDHTVPCGLFVCSQKGIIDSRFFHWNVMQESGDSERSCLWTIPEYIFRERQWCTSHFSWGKISIVSCFKALVLFRAASLRCLHNDQVCSFGLVRSQRAGKWFRITYSTHYTTHLRMNLHNWSLSKTNEMYQVIIKPLFNFYHHYYSETRFRIRFQHLSQIAWCGTFLALLTSDPHTGHSILQYILKAEINRSK